MAHKIPATFFRSGKTFLWRTNTVIPQNFSSILSGNLSYTRGLERTLKYLLRKLRFFMVKGTVKYSVLNAKHYLNILYLPRIKRRPLPDCRGILFNKVLYKNFKWNSSKLLSLGKKYVKQRRLKIYRFRSYGRKRLNRWLTRRLLRGSKKFRYKNLKFYRKTYEKKLRIKNYFLKNYNKKILWKKRWIFYQLKNKKSGKWNKKRKINTYKLSKKLSKLVHKKIKIKAMNVFNYLAAKNMIQFYTHQDQFWHFRYRSQRFYYKNYYDIVNSFLILCLIKNTENLLLDILRMMMPRIKRIRRFMFFLDKVIKNMIQIKNSFSCFRMILTGKISGGTRRTKVFAIGFGKLPVQSLMVEGTNNFMNYRHRYGEFGLKLILNRTFLNLKKFVPKNWTLDDKIR